MSKKVILLYFVLSIFGIATREVVFTMCTDLFVTVAILVITYLVIRTYEQQRDEMVFMNEQRTYLWRPCDCETLKTLQNISEQMKSCFMEEKQITITFSGGLETYTVGMHCDELIKNADHKLYDAKRNGKKQIICKELQKR